MKTTKLLFYALLSMLTPHSLSGQTPLKVLKIRQVILEEKISTIETQLFKYQKELNSIISQIEKIEAGGIDKHDNAENNKTSQILNLDLADNTQVFKNPTSNSIPYKNFKKQNVEVIYYLNGLYAIKSENGKIGYIEPTEIMDSSYELINSLNKKIIQSAEGQPIIIKGLAVKETFPSSGVELSIEWAFLDTTRTIQDIFFTVGSYDDNGDLQRCNHSGRSSFTGKISGPIRARKRFLNSNWNTAWFNENITCLKLLKVKVFYTDGSRMDYKNELSEIMNADFVNSCGN
ncbi:MAG: hypothetical protein DWQ02_15880 [Bacteroidetes bacterium]|nr:MAG: hypothetical protein DWQ02_15880 [Bacteroidota bacterium]